MATASGQWMKGHQVGRGLRQIVNDQGEKIGRVEVYQELTARKMFQSRMLQAEKLASLGQRASGIVHELAKPRTTILGNAQRLVLRDSVAGSTPEVLRIIEEAERASSILRQLLFLTGEAQPLRRNVFLHELAERNIGSQRAALTESSIELRMETDISLPPIDGDFAQLQQVLLNLLQNAQQAVEHSGKGRSIVVRAKRAGESHVRLEVWDDGPGIPVAVQARIYDPFFTTKPAGVGTGLGLSIAMGFVRQHGGTMTHLTPKQGGSCFVMEFPVAEGFLGRKAPITLFEAKLVHLPSCSALSFDFGIGLPSKNIPRVLVIEDEPTVAALIADVL